MRELGAGFFLELALRDRIFLLLAVSIAVFFLFAILFAIYAILLRIANIRKASRWGALEAAWEEEILEVLSGAHEPAVLWQRVNKRDALYFVEFLLRYARRLRGHERMILTELARPFLKQVADRVKGGDPERRAMAVQMLSALGLDDYIRELMAALDDPSPLVAMVAARALAREEYPEYAEIVLEKLHRFENWSQNYLASMLAAVGPGVTPALRETFSDLDKPPRVRAVAAEALQELSDFAAADFAALVLETETDRDLIAASLRLLGRVGRPEHLASIRALCTSSDFVIRAHAVSALGRIGEEEDIQPLRQAFEDPSQWVAIHTAWGLKEAGCVKVLREIAESEHPRADLAREILTEDEK